MHRGVVVSAVVLMSFAPAAAETTLTGGKSARFVDKPGADKDLARIRFSGGTGITSAVNPTCPAASSVRMSSSAQVNPEISLPCANWTYSNGVARYIDPAGTAGGVQRIIYKAGKLVIVAKGANYTPPVSGPVSFVDVRFKAGSASYCGRFSAFRRDDATVVIAKGPSSSCQSDCGNTIVEPGEQCDDGNADIGDNCRPNCTAEACGDGIQDPQEQCDDGNTADGDCCSSTCAYETVPCDDGDLCTSNDTCAAGSCAGTAIQPWINEFDYDDFFRGGNTDSDEFVEIAGKAGTDLGGYKIIAVEGNSTCAFTVFTGVTNGNANFTAVIPAGTVLQDDTGTGVGFLVACFTGTSINHVNAGHCDLVLPAPSPDTNLQNGDLLNSSPVNCPDGILLLDPSDNLADAISYEGQVPNVGNYGPYFHVTPYNAGQDRGWKTRVSFEKSTSTLGRATGASDWHLTGGCVNADLFETTCVEYSDSPGALNAGQDYSCAAYFCGDGIVTSPEECDDGEDNSNDPDADCRPDCTSRRCGDGIVDTAHGEQCEQDADCGAGTCFACECGEGPPLGALDFSVIPGPNALAPPDDGQSTLLRVTTTLGANNGSNGNWNPGPLKLQAGAPNASGLAPLILTEPVVLGANIPSAGGQGWVCYRLSQDPTAIGHVDCDGGSNFDVEMSVDSNGTGPNGATTLTVGAGASDSGAGAAVIRIIAEAGSTSSNAATCDTVAWGMPWQAAITTATATSTIANARQGGSTQVTLAGQPFNCSNWVENAGASIALTGVSLDVVLPLNLGTIDVAQVLRLNDD